MNISTPLNFIDFNIFTTWRISVFAMRLSACLWSRDFVICSECVLMRESIEINSWKLILLFFAGYRSKDTRTQCLHWHPSSWNSAFCYNREEIQVRLLTSLPKTFWEWGFDSYQRILFQSNNYFRWTIFCLRRGRPFFWCSNFYLPYPCPGNMLWLSAFE